MFRFFGGDLNRESLPSVGDNPEWQRKTTPTITTITEQPLVNKKGSEQVVPRKADEKTLINVI
jgi:hypothetical protein